MRLALARRAPASARAASAAAPARARLLVARVRASAAAAPSPADRPRSPAPPPAAAAAASSAAAPAPAPARSHAVPYTDDLDMLCFQCEQTAHQTGCTTGGVCGKTPEVALLMDLLTYQCISLASWCVLARQMDEQQAEAGAGSGQASVFAEAQAGASPEELLVANAMFATLTNVNFSAERIAEFCARVDAAVADLRDRVFLAAAQHGDEPPSPASEEHAWFQPLGSPVHFELRAHGVGNKYGSSNNGNGGLLPPTPESLMPLAEQASLKHRRALMGEAGNALLGLHELTTYGAKGACAYASHAAKLGEASLDAELARDLCALLAFLPSPQAADPQAALANALQVGRVNLRVMAALDKNHNARFGAPSPAQVRLTPVEGKAILVSGHDLDDLEAVLELADAAGVNVYTHSETLPAHGYPKLRAHKSLAGNYGGAWWKQRSEFDAFCRHGVVLMTTNCVLDPKDSYAERLFTTGEVGVDKSKHLASPKEFGKLIEAALAAPGFSAADVAAVGAPHYVTVGHGREFVLGAASAVVAAAKEGKLSHLYLVGGCDGPERSRGYYDALVDALPPSAAVITLGCQAHRIVGGAGKDDAMGTIPGTGLPRVLNMGQCSDSYGAISVATALAEALGCGVNELPLSLDIAWVEQKAVAVLLSCLSLGLKRIRLGPTLPAFLDASTVAFLIREFELTPANMSDPTGDLQAMAAGH